MRREYLLGCAILLAIAGCVACGGAATDEPGGGPTDVKTVRILLSADPASLSILGKLDGNADRLNLQLTDSLVQYDAGLRLQPRVAESWEVSDDRKTVTFHLRDGVRWHDGTPVTADDVVFTVEKVREPAVENKTYGPLFRDVESIEALDPSTVRVHYTKTTPDFLESWCVPLVPRHLAGVEEDLLTSEFARHPIGCGPFRFVSYRRGQEIVLEANDDYWDGRPQIDRLVFKIYPDQRTAYQALIIGDLDMMKVSPELWNEARQSEAGARLNAIVYSNLAVWPVIWNQDGSNPFFVDVRVRKALVHALDRDEFVEKVAHGLANPGITTYHPESPWADASLKPREYDRERAERLLDEAGWRDRDGDGIRDREGRPFRFTLLTPNSSFQLVQQIAVWQQDAWKQIGVHAEIERMEWQAFRERRNAGNFEAVSFLLRFTPNPDQFDLYHSSATETGFNFYGLNDAEIDRLVELGRATFDQEERVAIYGQLQQALYEREPITCTFNFASPVLYDRRLSGVTASPLGVLLTTEGPRLWRWTDDAAPED
jgi:peptide/nickel transport system substrate-binding protein